MPRSNPRLKTVRVVTIFNILLVAAMAVFCILVNAGKIVLPDTKIKLILAIYIALLIIGFGNIAPKLPFNRHTGLRLPWTVGDEDAAGAMDKGPDRGAFTFVDSYPCSDLRDLFLEKMEGIINGI